MVYKTEFLKWSSIPSSTGRPIAQAGAEGWAPATTEVATLPLLAQNSSNAITSYSTRFDGRYRYLIKK